MSVPEHRCRGEEEKKRAISAAASSRLSCADIVIVSTEVIGGKWRSDVVLGR